MQVATGTFVVVAVRHDVVRNMLPEFGVGSFAQVSVPTSVVTTVGQVVAVYMLVLSAATGVQAATGVSAELFVLQLVVV